MAVGKRNILVVDDSAVNLKMAGKVLAANEDYKAVLVPSGKVALKYLSTNSAELILLDVMMPEMDGFELLERLRADEATKDIPVVFLTADDEGEIRQRADELGVKDIILKPFRKESLLTMVENILHKSGPEGD